MAAPPALALLTARVAAARVNAFRVGFVVRHPVGQVPGATPTTFNPHRTVPPPTTTTTQVLEP